jgi:hypothetical protein
MSEPQPRRHDNEPLTDSANSVFIVADGPVDTTVRPARPALRSLLRPQAPAEPLAQPEGSPPADPT